MSVKRVYTFPYKTHIQIAQDYAEDRLCRKKPTVFQYTPERAGKTVFSVPYSDDETSDISASDIENQIYGSGKCLVIGVDANNNIVPASDSHGTQVIHDVLNPYPFSIPPHDPECDPNDMDLKTWNTVYFQIYCSYRGEYIIGNIYGPPKLMGFASDSFDVLKADTKYPIILRDPYLGSSVINAEPDWTIEGMSLSKDDKVSLEYSIEKRKWFFFSRKRGGTSDFVPIDTTQMWVWQGEYKGRAVIFEGDPCFTAEITGTYPVFSKTGYYRFLEISADSSCRVFVQLDDGVSWASPYYNAVGTVFAVRPEHNYAGTVSFSVTGSYLWPRKEFGGWGGSLGYTFSDYLSGFPASDSVNTCLVVLYSNNILTASGTMDLTDGAKTQLVLSEDHGNFSAGETVELQYHRPKYMIQNGRFTVDDKEYLFGVPVWDIGESEFTAGLVSGSMNWCGKGSITVDGVTYSGFSRPDGKSFWVLGTFLDAENGWYQVSWNDFDIFGVSILDHYTMSGKSSNKESLTMEFKEIQNIALEDDVWKCAVERC